MGNGICINGEASSGLPDLFAVSPRRSLGIIIFSCDSVFCKDEAKHFSLPNPGSAFGPMVDIWSPITALKKSNAVRKGGGKGKEAVKFLSFPVMLTRLNKIYVLR